MIGMIMREYYLSHSPALGYHCVDEYIQFFLFFLVRRGRVDDDQFIAAYDVAVCVGRRRKRRCSDREEKNAGAKLNSPNHPVLGFWNCGQCCRQLLHVTRVRSERSNDVKRRRRHNDLAALPTRQRFSRSYPLTGFKLACFDQGLLTFRHPREEEPGVKPPRCKVRRHPSSCRFKVRTHDLERVFFESLFDTLEVLVHSAALFCDTLERQTLRALRQQHACFFEELPNGTGSHDGFFAVATCYGYRAVFLVELSAWKGMKSAHELELRASLDPKDF